ncbi:protein late bloomer isoform X2 [Drosophila teissieri]|uniref:protein late bloomer isoform X2 n=1 Tax=Drosophila teissieri TaxID=7243 RepID=UPI001CB9FA5E|nr:protein late bloomer isoform X2 [Drosophila teissieri]
MACRTSFLKAVLIVLNVLLSLIGVTLIALSVYELNSSTPGTFEHIAIVVQIFVGTFVVLTSFLGCFATARVSLGLVWSYVICLLILLCLQIYIIAAAHSTDYVERSRKDFLVIWADQRANVERISLVEQKYSCCGQLGAHDYILMGRGIPLSCYRAQERRENTLFPEGCQQAVQAHATDNVAIGLIIKWLLLLVELGALGAATHLGITVRNKLRRERF